MFGEDIWEEVEDKCDEESDIDENSNFICLFDIITVK